MINKVRTVTPRGEEILEELRQAIPYMSDLQYARWVGNGEGVLAMIDKQRSDQQSEEAS